MKTTLEHKIKMEYEEVLRNIRSKGKIELNSLKQDAVRMKFLARGLKSGIRKAPVEKYLEGLHETDFKNQKEGYSKWKSECFLDRIIEILEMLLARKIDVQESLMLLDLVQDSANRIIFDIEKTSKEEA